ncbi:glutathione S-transferase family protein [Flavobacterium sp. MXW15]|uniref:Glutathione S-transferase family protein n=1 Tax=Xanthomonas chitinilytica TaxID=2989819 RepID=A0ABT3JVP1_9XANT|nr:glutathione S-transferase family protein [Xanthomonas sp. H13-6]MCW4454818.1 glutathione S-transferase family protein [Flavobacterium sp. MXW15]MCW4472554.1 glutathione S-transferase family protein [Xanthomonas sp. H13-6]
MTATLTFYTNPLSRARLTRWMLEETGLPYDEVVLEFGTTMKSPEYLAINPMGKVPAIRHGDMVVTENAAICAYLADLVPEKGLAPPPGSPERGAYYRWLFFLAGPLEAWLTARSTGTLAPAVGAGYGEEGDVLRTLEQALQGRTYLAGDRFTAADLYAAASLSYYMMIGAIEKNPVFEAYVAHHVGRPAAVAANNRDNALAAEHPAAG